MVLIKITLSNIVPFSVFYKNFVPIRLVIVYMYICYL